MIKSAMHSKKFVTMFALTVATAAMVWTGKLSGAEWIEFVQWIGAAYLVGQGIADRAKS